MRHIMPIPWSLSGSLVWYLAIFSEDPLVAVDPEAELNATQAEELLEQAADLYYTGQPLLEKEFIEWTLVRLIRLCPDTLACWDALPPSARDHQCALRPDVVLRLCRSEKLPLGSHHFSRATILRILTHPRYGQAFSSFDKFSDWTEIPEEERRAFADYWVCLSGQLKNGFLRWIVEPLEQCTRQCQEPRCQSARENMFERGDLETPFFWLTTLFPEGRSNRLAIAARLSEMCRDCRAWVPKIWGRGRIAIWNMLPPNCDDGYVKYVESLAACRGPEEHVIGDRPEAGCDVERDSRRSLVPWIAYGTLANPASVEDPAASQAQAALQCVMDMYTYTNSGSALNPSTAWTARLLLEPLHPPSLSSWDCLPCAIMDRQHLATVFRLIHEVNNGFPDPDTFLCAALLRILQAYGRDAAAIIEREPMLRKVCTSECLPNGTASSAMLGDLYCVLCTETYADVQVILERFATSWTQCSPTCNRQAECTRFAMQTYTELSREDAVRDCLRILFPEGPHAREQAFRTLYLGFCMQCVQYRASLHVWWRQILWNSLGDEEGELSAPMAIQSLMRMIGMYLELSNDVAGLDTV